jgi:hypothetical protein
MRYSRNTGITKAKCLKQNKKLHRNWVVYFHHQFGNDARLQTGDGIEFLHCIGRHKFQQYSL